MSLGPVLTPILTPVVYVLAVMRVTRLINFDTVLDWLRVWIGNRAAAARDAAIEAESNGQTIIAEGHTKRLTRWNGVFAFLQCPWCVGFWVAVGTAWLPLYRADNPLVQYAGVALAASMIIGLAAPHSADPLDVVDPDPAP